MVSGKVPSKNTHKESIGLVSQAQQLYFKARTKVPTKVACEAGVLSFIACEACKRDLLEGRMGSGHLPQTFTKSPDTKPWPNEPNRKPCFVCSFVPAHTIKTSTVCPFTQARSTLFEDLFDHPTYLNYPSFNLPGQHPTW